jgi:BirA family biotin operon repressor/biotin-[acetyl-CoA-carboxylase] ligase
MTMPDTALTKALQRVRENGYVLLQDWPRDVASASELGLVKEDGVVRLPTDVRLHDLDSIRKGLPDQLSVQLYDYIDSTNSAMLRRHEVRRHEVRRHEDRRHLQAGAANHLILTEFQSAGRGRRGKVWLGDYGRNIAMTLGIELQTNLNALGGLSSVVGLALLQALELEGVHAQLKWPNDVWVKEQKLAGILVELVPTKTGTLAVVGIGINADLTNAQASKIDQSVTSLRRLGASISRDDLVVAVCTSLLENFDVYSRDGFAPFLEAFDSAHCLHDQAAILVLGGESQEGIVRGVDITGGLRFEQNGVTRVVSSGEVSLRPAAREEPQ